MRERLGAEMTATLLEASAGSRPRFARELASLARLGLHARGEQTAAAGTRRMLTAGLCLAGVWLMTLDLSTLLAQRVRGMHDPLLAPASLVLLGVALALALVGYDRLAGLTALAWTAARLPILLDDHPALLLTVATLPSVLCFGLLVAAPRERPRDPRELLWFVVPAGLAATLGPLPGDQSPLMLAIVAVCAIAVVLYALATLTTDPRVAIAAAVCLTTVGLGHVVPTAAAPLVLLIAVVRVRQLRRQVPI